MAEPLSIAASIAGLVTLADIVFIRLVKYSRAVKDADRDIKALCTEVNLLSGALHSLSQLTRGFDEDSGTSKYRIHQIDECDVLLTQLKSKFPDPDQNQKSVIKRLRWPLTSMRTKDVLTELSALKNNIVLSLQSTSMDALLRCLTKSEEIHIDIRTTLEITNRVVQDGKQEKLRQKFLTHNPQSNYDTSLKLRHPRTGLWLERTAELQNWLRLPNSRLWLSGIPGAGKTVLAATVIERALAVTDESRCTAFFFCDYKDSTTQQPITVLCALAFQIAIQSQAAYDLLQIYYNELNPPHRLPRDPGISDLINVMIEMLECYEMAFLVVDGIDECGPLAGNVMSALFDVVDGLDTVSLAILSRNEVHISEKVQSSETRFTNIEITAHTEDVQEYVLAEIDQRVRDGRLRVDDPSLKDSILTGLVEGSKGMFRWVACQLDHLGHCISDEECRQALRKLPPDLNETYLRILRMIPENRRALVSIALAFIAHAWLSVEDLREALSFDEKKGSAEGTGNLIRTNDILRLCSSLVRKSISGLRLELAHFSVEEFLKDDTVLTGELRQFSLGPHAAETRIAKQCLRYIQLPEFAFRSGPRQSEIAFVDSFLETHAFYRWASQAWPSFARRACSDTEVFQSAKNLFDPVKTPNFVLWGIAYLSAFDDDTHRLAELIPEDSELFTMSKLISLVNGPDWTPLHCSALLGIQEVCSHLIALGCNINQTCAAGTPLRSAILGLEYSSLDLDLSPFDESEMYAETMKTLIEAGASMGPFPEPFPPSLLDEAASFAFFNSDYVTVIVTLLSHGYDLQSDMEHIPNVVGNISEGLSDHYIDVDDLIKLLDCLSPLLEASPAHSTLFDQLWRLGSQQTDFCYDPLELHKSGQTSSLPASRIFGALEAGNFGLMRRILVDPPALIADMRDDGDKSLLQAALDLRYRGDYDCLETELDELLILLLKAGCNSYEPSVCGMTPFEEWCKLKPFATGPVIQAWYQSGITVSTRHSENRNTLHLAYDNPELLRKILASQMNTEDPAPWHAVDDSGYTPFTQALEADHIDSATLLYKADRETWTSPVPASCLAVQAGAMKILTRLIQDGYRYENGESEHSPLRFLPPRASAEFVEFLKSFDPEAVSSFKKGQYPFECWLERCFGELLTMNDNARAVLESLTQPWMQALDAQSRSAIWIRLAERLHAKCVHLEGDDDKKNFLQSTIVFLAENSILAAYESSSANCAIMELTKHVVWKSLSLDDLRPLPTNALYPLLEHTGMWSEFKRTDDATRLLVSSVQSNDIRLCTLLAANGVSPHDRVGGRSALEVAVTRDCQCSGAEIRGCSGAETLNQLLESNDPARLNDLNPKNGDGLIHAVRCVSIVTALLHKGVDINLRRVHQDRPALVHHIAKRSFSIANLLLDCGADPKLSDSLGTNAILEAAMTGANGIFSRLSTSAGALSLRLVKCRIFGFNRDVDVDLNEANALHLAALKGHIDIVDMCLSNKIPGGVNATSDTGWTALHFAAAGGHSELLTRLIQRYGADVNVKSHSGGLPLHEAVLNHRIGAARRLLELGSKWHPNKNEITPLGLAYRSGAEQLIHLIKSKIEEAVDGPQSLRGEDVREMRSTFEAAARADDLTLCQRLYERGVSVDTNLASCGCCSPLIAAIQGDAAVVLEWLLEIGSGTLMVDCDSTPAIRLLLRTTLCRAKLDKFLELYFVQGGRVQPILSSLIFAAWESEDNRALEIILHHAAIREQSSRSLSYLINMPYNDFGHRPLHYAIMRGNVETAALLLKYDAQINASPIDLSTPLFFLKESSAEISKMATLLLSNGAFLECQNISNLTPLEANIIHERHTASRVLQAAGARPGSFLDNAAPPFPPWGRKYIPREIYFRMLRDGRSPYDVNPDGWSLWLGGICREDMTSFSLNSDVDLDLVTLFPWHSWVLDDPWLTTKFRQYRRRIPPKTLRHIANLHPTTGWSPLCRFACRGWTEGMENLMWLGADIDFEGCMSGSALMAAAERGQFNSIKLLVRGGASISYHGPHGFRSAALLASRYESVMQWLLADRFRDQLKLTECEDLSSAGSKPKPWSGYHKVEMNVGKAHKRYQKTSGLKYLVHLEKVKRQWRGRVIPESRQSDFMG